MVMMAAMVGAVAVMVKVMVKVMMMAIWLWLIVNSRVSQYNREKQRIGKSSILSCWADREPRFSSFPGKSTAS